ncbi:hypothetical protein CC1G_10616 [Coprinopsis cinerea okayama7|uniref:Uncharacterized protein n=1 Tax=Coprinopsis cinerea (strain Okayama-7 / 130 / ATCC MYA-4618 / FGSC 9003) TaxID=240176 RepID=A8P8S1_COPC7|nr:hypothetical protein CC1G_10616 [Coprinopsis cinerea okayama7\|eukprot:XP_001839623.1 hypothetical protein CC1G_10616 [Coprinopsis cinerea okayama7\
MFAPELYKADAHIMDAVLISGLSLLSAYLLYLSFKVNPRATEDVTHPIWNLIMIRLCQGRFDRLLPTMQFRLYISPYDPNLEDPAPDPNETRPDPKARGVITDCCILAPTIGSRDDPLASPSTFLTRVISQLSKMPIFGVAAAHLSSYLREGTVSKIMIPLLVELKRPVSRHCSDILAYALALQKTLDDARKQVYGQAHCLFSSPKYAEQSAAVIIAATGGWWTFKVIHRDAQIGRFRAQRYFKFRDQTDKDENEQEDYFDGVSTVDDETLENPGKKDLLAAANANWENRRADEQKHKALRVERQRKERRERIEKRNQRDQEPPVLDFFERAKGNIVEVDNSDSNYANVTALLNFCDSIPQSTFYDLDQLQELSRHLQKCKSLTEFELPERQPDFNVKVPGKINYRPKKHFGYHDRSNLDEWIGPLLVGSEASDRCLELIQEALASSFFHDGGANSFGSK